MADDVTPVPHVYLEEAVAPVPHAAALVQLEAEDVFA